MSVADLRGILTYIPRFREKIFVIAIDGNVIAHENFPNTLLDLAVLRSLNIKLVLVHGAGHQIQELSKQTGTAITNFNGIGITDETTLNLSLVACNRITHEVLEGLASNDLRACSTNAIIAHPFGIVGGVDHQFTGRVERIDVDFLNDLLTHNIIPIIPPLGFDGDGRTFRVNSDRVAQAVAQELKAAKLIYLGDCSGIQNPQNGYPTQLSVIEAEEYVKRRRAEINLELLSKLECCIRACHEGVNRAHLIDARRDEGLLTEVFSHEGVGTMIYANEYLAIRRAGKKDVRAILSLIQESVQAEELAKRTRQSVLAQIQDYFVFEIDRSIAGCVALHPFPEEGKAELACLYVHKGHENKGIGRKLMLFVEAQARERGFKELFALSTQAFNYFQQKGGYREVPIDYLPKLRREKYDSSGRNSKVLTKTL